MVTFDQKMQALTRNIWETVERGIQEREIEDIAADPKKHKLTRLMADGKSANYRYYQAKNGKGQVVKFCWNCNRNAAGYFLSWRQTHLKKARKDGTIAKRDMWSARKVKNKAEALAMKRVGRLRVKFPILNQVKFPAFEE